MAVVVSPVDANVVYAGGVYDYTRNRPASVVGSNDGGNTWTLVGSSTGGGNGKVHTDVHAFAFAADGSMLYVGSDGGVWSTPDAATPTKLNWTGLNTTIATAQFYPGFAVNANKVRDALGGTQDNGSILYAGHLMWSNVTCGDGGFSAIDATTKPSTYYAACTYSQGIVKSTTGGGPNSWLSADSGINFRDPGLFIPPMMMDPSNPQTLYYGTNRVYRTTNGASSWVAISPQPLPSRGGVVSTIAPSASDPKTIYEGASDGTVAVTTNGGTDWTDLSPGLPGRYVSHVAVDPNQSTIAYVTYSGFSGFNGDKQGHVFRTSDGGMHWTDVSGNLPNIPVDDLVVDPVSTSTLYAATDVGVFITTDTGKSWAALGAGLPNVAVLSLVLQQNSRTLAAATHGRSVWYLTGF